jgi:hypothetical protein
VRQSSLRQVFENTESTIDQVLKEAGPLWELRGSSDSKELPPLLRPVFRAYVARTKLNMVDEIDHDIFAGWIRLLRGLASELRHGTAAA